MKQKPNVRSLRVCVQLGPRIVFKAFYLLPNNARSRFPVIRNILGLFGEQKNVDFRTFFDRNCRKSTFFEVSDIGSRSICENNDCNQFFT